MQCSVGFAFVSAQPASAKIGNNVAIACKLPWTWREVKDGREAPVVAGFASGANAVYASADEAGFADAAHYDFRLNPDAKLLRDLPAFQPIPIKKIGLYLDEYRRALPADEEIDRFDRQPHGAVLGYDIGDRK